MSVNLSQAAAERVRDHLAKRGHGIGLRVGIKKTGCSGFAYVIDFADDVGDGDHVFEDRGIKVVVDGDSIAYIDGTVVDFTRDGLNEAFRFRNPNVKDTCGCGESFTI